MKKIILIILGIIIATSSFVVAADISVDSDKQSFKEKDNKIMLEGNVKVKYDDINIASPHAEVEVDSKTQKVSNIKFENNAYSYQVKGTKKQEIKANILKMSLLDKVLYAEKNTQTVISENQKPVVVVTADNQQYNKNTNTMNATGNVIVYYKDIETYSEKAILALDSKNEVKKLELVGNAKFKQKDNLLKADSLLYDNVREEATATGHVYTDVNPDGKDRLLVQSDYQFYDKKRNFITASGGTIINYKDYVATGPKANVFPSKDTNKLNEVIFVGRSKIKNGPRTIEADKITMTLNPKDFNAEGNVKTRISDVKGFN